MRRRFLMTWGLALLALFTLGGVAGAQEQGQGKEQEQEHEQEQELEAAGARVQRAWLSHDVSGIVAAGPAILLQLPGAEPAPAVDRAQAAALLRDYLAGTVEMALSVRAAREVDPGVGYVELARRYRVAGTQEVRAQRVLLGYRRAGARWELAEVRVVE